LDHAPHPGHHPDDLEGEHRVALNPGHETPHPLPPGLPEVEPIRGFHEVHPAIFEGRVLLNDELIPGAEGPGPAIVHSAAPHLIQSCASHEAMVARGKRVVKEKNCWNPPPRAPGLRMD